MQFALLYQYDPAHTGPSEGEVEDWIAFDAATREAGVLVHEAGFQPASTARTVTVREGQNHVADGVATTSGDVVAGFYVIDVADAEAAAEWARRVPTAGYGKVEVRPVVEF